jgi:hypothetical protein
MIPAVADRLRRSIAGAPTFYKHLARLKMRCTISIRCLCDYICDVKISLRAARRYRKATADENRIARSALTVTYQFVSQTRMKHREGP